MARFTSSRDPPSSVRGSAQDVPERPLEIVELEAVAALERLARQGALPFEEDLGHLSDGEAERKGGNRQERWPAQGASERAGEILHPRRIRRRGVDRPPDGSVERPEDEADLVADVDPGYPLPARPDRTAGERLEGRD